MLYGVFSVEDTGDKKLVRFYGMHEWVQAIGIGYIVAHTFDLGNTECLRVDSAEEIESAVDHAYLIHSVNNEYDGKSVYVIPKETMCIPPGQFSALPYDDSEEKQSVSADS